jgi:hypothetical protein
VPDDILLVVVMWLYQDVWTGAGYRRQIQGCTLQVLMKHDDSQHVSAARQLHNYCGYFGYDGPIVIGRGCHNIWRPTGFAAHGTRELYALEVFSPEMTRETFAALFGKTPDKRQYLPGEVVVYGQGEMAVCLDGYGGSEVAIPLSVFSSADSCMVDFPYHVPRHSLVSSTDGIHVLRPIWGLVVALGQWVRLQAEIVYAANDPRSSQWAVGLQYRQAALAVDVHDFQYLCYSQAKFQGVRVTIDDPNLANARRNAEAYLRSFHGSDVYSEAERETATDHFIEIGLYPRGTVLGPRYDIPGQRGWTM